MLNLGADGRRSEAALPEGEALPAPAEPAAREAAAEPAKPAAERVPALLLPHLLLRLRLRRNVLAAVVLQPHVLVPKNLVRLADFVKILFANLELVLALIRVPLQRALFVRALDLRRRRLLADAQRGVVILALSHADEPLAALEEIDHLPRIAKALARVVAVRLRRFWVVRDDVRLRPLEQSVRAVGVEVEHLGAGAYSGIAVFALDVHAAQTHVQVDVGACVLRIHLECAGKGFRSLLPVTARLRLRRLVCLLHEIFHFAMLCERLLVLRIALQRLSEVTLARVILHKSHVSAASQQQRLNGAGLHLEQLSCRSNRALVFPLREIKLRCPQQSLRALSSWTLDCNSELGSAPLSSCGARRVHRCAHLLHLLHLLRRAAVCRLEFEDTREVRLRAVEAAQLTKELAAVEQAGHALRIKLHAAVQVLERRCEVLPLHVCACSLCVQQCALWICRNRVPVVSDGGGDVAAPESFVAFSQERARVPRRRLLRARRGQEHHQEGEAQSGHPSGFQNVSKVGVRCALTSIGMSAEYDGREGADIVPSSAAGFALH
mmetsp:Transcript_29306/g.95513  ORF Transcript_29306/g.95513 Transcript_29306/m.95513 type:complete len:550 (+) Transcript_29306:54-1703(+)